MCVSGYMECQNRDSKKDFFCCSKFFTWANRETVCQNGKILWNPLKIKKKLGSVVKN